MHSLTSIKRVHKWLKSSIAVSIPLGHVAGALPHRMWALFLYPLECGFGHVACFVQWIQKGDLRQKLENRVGLGACSLLLLLQRR